MTELLRTLFFSVLLTLAGCATGHTGGIHGENTAAALRGGRWPHVCVVVTCGNSLQRLILLLHGRTWSALPDFDLQIPVNKLPS